MNKKKIGRQMKTQEVSLTENEGTVLYFRNHPTLAAKYLLNVSLSWIQRLALKAIWNKPFIMLIWGRRCLPQYTHIIMADGSWKYLKDIKVGDKILSWNGSSYVEDEVIRVWETGKKKITKLNVFGLNNIDTTDDHRFFVSKQNGKIKCKKFCEINEKENLITYSELNNEGKNIRYISELIGYLITDGSVNDDQTPKFTNNNINIINRVSYLVSKVFGINYKGKLYKKGINGYDIVFSDGNHGTKNKIKEFFKNNNACYKKDKRRVPSILWKANKESILKFFSGVLAGDGNIHIFNEEEGNINGRRFYKNKRIEVKIIAGESEQLAWDYYWLLRKIGIKPTSVEKDKRSGHNCWMIRIFRGYDVYSLLKDITIIGKEEKRKEAVNITKNSKNRIIEKNSYIRFSFKKNGNYEDLCYDLTTKYNNSFVANGYAVHNCGKTYIGAVSCILRAMLYPGEKVLIVAPSKRQVDWIFINDITTLYTNSDYFRASVVGKIVVMNSYDRIKFANGSIVEGFPVGIEGGKVRGAGANFLWIDEYAQMSESVINLVFKPMLAVTKKGSFNRYLITSSAYYRWNHMWNLFQYYVVKQIMEPKNYYVSNFNYKHVLLSKNIPVEFDLNMFEQMKETMTDIEFKMETFAVFPEDAEGFFSSRLIDEATPKPPDKKPVEIEMSGDGKSEYYMGVDVGRAEGGSNFSISIIKKQGKIGKVVHVITANGATFQEMTEMVRRKFIDFHVTKIKMDAGGGGLTLKDLLREPWIDTITHQSMKPIVTIDDAVNGIHALEMVKFSDEVHNSLFMNLKAEMEHGRILFPMDLRRDVDLDLERVGNEIITLKNEMRVTTAKPKGKYLRFEVPNRFNNDRIVSTALALDCYLESIRYNEYDSEELAVGGWIKF